MNRTAVKYGIFTGFAVIVYLFVFYLYDKAAMRSAGVIWSSTIIYFVGMFMAAFSIHRHRGMEEELPVKQMIVTPFIVFLIANAYYALFFYWIMNVYDPDFLVLHQELTKEEMLEFYKGTETVKEIRKMQLSDFTPTFMSLFKRYVFGAIGGFALSVLIGLIVRRT